MRIRPQGLIKVPPQKKLTVIEEPFDWQKEVLENIKKRNSRTVLRIGRQAGKTALLEAVAVSMAIAGYQVGWFAMDYKRMIKPWERIKEKLKNCSIKTDSSKMLIMTERGGSFRMWTLGDEDAGRGDPYDLIIIDEAAFADDMANKWQLAIEPTLLTRKNARVLVASTPNGDDPDNWFFQICQKDSEFRQFHWPSSISPLILTEYWKKIEEKTPALVFQQEYLAEFVNWRSQAFFREEDFLIDGNPVDIPTGINSVYACMDTTLKGGEGRDGTAVVYFAATPFNPKTPITILDWEITEQAVDTLADWTPKVLERCEYYARQTRALRGSLGLFVEDAAAGASVILPTARRKGWKAQKLPQDWTSIGKDQRALKASVPVAGGKVKIAKPAWEKRERYHGEEANHLVKQLFSFYMADKEAYKRADDLLDCCMYGILKGAQ